MRRRRLVRRQTVRRSAIEFRPGEGDRGGFARCGKRVICITVRSHTSDTRNEDRAAISAAAGRPRSSSVKRGAAVALFYSALTVCFTWPLAPDLSTRVIAHFDPPFSAWRLARVVHNVSNGLPLFDGEIFWPARQTLAFSDAMLAQAVLAWPLLATGFTPLAVLNVLTLAGVAGSATAAYVLARRLTGHTGGALVAGLVFAFAPYRRDHLQHIELQWALWTPLALWAWHRALDGGRARDGLLCAAFVLLQLLSCIYYGVFLAVAMAVICPLTLIWRRGRLGRGALGGLVAGAVVVAVAAAAYYRPYALARELVGERDLDETARYSADASSYLAATPDNLLYGALTESLGANEKRLFPGITPIALSIVALIPPVPPVCPHLRRLDGGRLGRVARNVGTRLPSAPRVAAAVSQPAGAGALRHDRPARDERPHCDRPGSDRANVFGPVRGTGCGGDAHPGIQHDTAVGSMDSA